MYDDPYEEDVNFRAARALPGVRDEVEWFARLQEEKLGQKDKRGWGDGWKLASPAVLLAELRRHVDKLAVDLATGNLARVQPSAADCGNFAMFIAWHAREKPDAALSSSAIRWVDVESPAPYVFQSYWQAEAAYMRVAITRLDASSPFVVRLHARPARNLGPGDALLVAFRSDDEAQARALGAALVCTGQAFMAAVEAAGGKP